MHICRGIYVPDDDRWPKHFRGMGIRIEDSVAVQEKHPYVLTTEAVKEVGFPFIVPYLRTLSILTCKKVDDIEALRT